VAAVKWALVLFAVAALALLLISKAITLVDPPRRGRPPSPGLRRVERALRWTLAVPALLGLALLAWALLRGGAW
jgi:hypothetical protein